MATTMVRVNEETEEALKRLSADFVKPISVVLGRAVAAYERKVFLEEAAKDYARLRTDPAAWAEELKERELWEGTLLDGLEHDESYPRRDMAR